jgi:hypothetical protein
MARISRIRSAYLILLTSISGEVNMSDINITDNSAEVLPSHGFDAINEK